MSSTNVDESRERLLASVRRFQQKAYPQRKRTYQQLVQEGRKPHAHFLTCVEPRIDPELITKSGMNEILVSRNIGNLVPPYGHAALEERIEENVLLQLHHLRTHPSIAGRLVQGTLGLSGWVYGHIGRRIIRIYGEEQRKFVPLSGDEQATVGASSR